MTAHSTLPIDLMIESTAGGSMRHVMDLYEALTARGHDVRLIVSLLRAEATVNEWLVRLPAGHVIRADTSRGPSFRDISLIRRLRSTLSSAQSPRLLHGHSTKAGILTSLLKEQASAVILTPHAYRGMDPSLSSFSKRAIGLVEALFSRNVDHIIAVSPDEVAYARELGVPAGRISYIPNGIDVERIRACTDANRSKLADLHHHLPVLGFVGRMTRQKNPLLFLQTFARLHTLHPDLKGVMIGDGDMLPQVRQQRAELGLEDAVDLPGALNFTDEMHRIDVMVHTSLYESLPYVLLEGGAGGLAVVAVRNAGSEAIWPSEALCDHTPDALAAKLAPLLADPAALQQAREVATAGAARFSINAMVDQTEEVYRLVLYQTVNGRESRL